MTLTPWDSQGVQVNSGGFEMESIKMRDIDTGAPSPVELEFLGDGAVGFNVAGSVELLHFGCASVIVEVEDGRLRVHQVTGANGDVVELLSLQLPNFAPPTGPLWVREDLDGFYVRLGLRDGEGVDLGAVYGPITSISDALRHAGHVMSRRLAVTA